MASGTHTARADDGFTLIELLVVVIIIGILAAIALPTFLAQRERAWRSEMQSDLRVAAVSMEAYFTDNGAYHQAALHADFGYHQSPNVDVNVVQTSGTAYCMTADHLRLDETWQIGTGILLAEGDCT